MIILGVDPGTLFTGYAVIGNEKGRMVLIECDVIKNPSSDTLPVRLKNIYDSLVKVIDEHKPDEFAIETAYYGKNVQSTLKLGHARGVSILAAVNKQIPTTEYSPREVKKSVVGIGSASKEQVRFMVCQILKIKDKPKSLDITDALAVALCHYNKVMGHKTTSQSWEDYVARNPKKVIVKN
ncbi:MAG: crossover junction endodeoxyribonuclease RuvC [Ignavibacteriae bacterium]|nr:MAG: crossover junction endodeoxyribonuclease RuvC [Ignavibacteriota bacterium]